MLSKCVDKIGGVFARFSRERMRFYYLGCCRLFSQLYLLTLLCAWPRERRDAMTENLRMASLIYKFIHFLKIEI